jgi:site-specific DNA recombinase
LELRGTKKADWSNLNVPVPHDGGIRELIRDASLDRFDGVIVESIDRVARMTADSTRVEQELERAGVVLFAADEPMLTNATAILTRRVKQGVSEWYIRDLLERSRRGMEESVRQGWHTGGRPPYGYMLEQHDHPNPSKAREGKHKHRLILDSLRAEVVLLIFEDYCVRLLGLGAICDKLNRNNERYPPPIPNRKNETNLGHTWSRGVIQAILRNPKYTGYNVWNRHDKRRGHPLIRPREEWIWSAEPTHPAILPRELFDMVEERAQRNGNAAKAGLSRESHKSAHTTARRIYPLRGRVRCGLCGFRMEGSHQKGSNWYRCQYVYRRGPAAATIAGHPKVYGIKEDKILGPVLDFLARRVFGPDRLQLLRDELGAATASTWADHADDLKRLEAELTKINRALRNQTLRLEEHEDPNHPIVALASERIVELTTERAPLRAQSKGSEQSVPLGAIQTR